MELKDIPKIGSKTISLLNNMGIYSISDLIRNYPYRYEVLARRNIDDTKYYDNITVDGIVESVPLVSFFKKKMNKMTFRVNIQSKIIRVVIFNRAFMKNNIKVGSYITVIGKYTPNNDTITATNLLFRTLSNDGEIIPVYHTCKGISQKQMHDFIISAIDGSKIEKTIPKELSIKYHFLDEEKAIRIINSPNSEKELKEALRTLKYEELFSYLLKLKKIKLKNEEHNKLFCKNVDLNMVNKFIKSLPFELTLDQINVTNEMIDNLISDTKMNRLLQGDVGSGKTVVAFILAYACYTAGYQSVLMAPTEVLALQHYENAIKLFNNTDIKVGLLIGKMSLNQKKEVYNQLENGMVNFVIGTHALISDKVKWNNLGLVITDEQHRFGVNQRLKLKDKAVSPDVLMMSATPIPRTYALTIYGDTDISSIKTKPKGRKEVITYVKKTDELKDVLNGIYTSLKNNNQIYVIAPMIEENEDTDYTNVYDLKHKFELAFKNYTVEILHGKMSSLEKDKIMEDYLNNKINILISTTVIEVGVDVKNATVIVIFDADRFGLSTLHQLRGRVGRNDLQSYCYLISDKDKERLKIMEKTCDGFEISEEDFKLRGQGDLFGSRQSGVPSFKLSDVKKDYDLMLKVKKDVELVT